MERWKEICGQQAARLNSALEVCKHAEALCRHGTVRPWINMDDLAIIEKAQRTIRSRLPRLQNGEFHIAVVGAEKAGKSSFINAWIGADLLPNKSSRCTYTTTKLHSVKTIEEQRLEITTKTREEFELLVSGLREQAASRDERSAANASKDLAIIEKFKAEMLELVDHRIDPVPFNDLEEIRGLLERYAADEHYAHAIAKVDLYTKNLASMDGLLFYDVPGIDSGLEKHTEETRRMLEDSDAVIMVKRLAEPSIKGHEEEILRYAASGDSSIPVKDKLFFFFSRIDDEKTREGFLKNCEEAYRACDEYGIDRTKIIFGSAASALRIAGKLRDTDYIEAVPVLKKKLQEILGLPDDSDATILQGAGMEAIKSRLDTYLGEEREKILRKSCDRIINDIICGATRIRDAVRARIPDDPDQMANRHKEELLIAFNEWFSQSWRAITAGLASEQAGGVIEDTVAAMSDSYRKLADEALDNLQYFNPETRDLFFSSYAAQHGAQDYPAMNTEIRKKINEELILKLQSLAFHLSYDLFDRLMHYIQSISAKFNNSLDIEKMLLTAMEALPKEQYQKQLNSALGALYLRFARPLARGLMQYRHGLAERKEQARKNARVYYALSGFYPDEEPEKFGNLARYIAGSGKTHETAEKAQDQAVGAEAGIGEQMKRRILQKAGAAAVGGLAAGPLGAGIGAVAGDILAGDRELQKTRGADEPVCGSRQDVVDELEEDRKALRAYLGAAVFTCAGIEDFAESELERIQRIFMSKEDMARALALNAYANRDPAFMKMLPDNLRNTECDTRVANLLQQLNISLKDRTEA